MNNTSLSNTRFDQLPLDQRLLKALTDLNFEFCTPIQAETIPHLLENQDIAGQAQTGTGKTASFLLVAMQLLLTSDTRTQTSRPRAIIVSPTRELAIQIHQDAMDLNQYANLKFALVYGGVDYKKQLDQLDDEIDILIGTPGRLIDYFKQHAYRLNEIEAVVLDEADRMFDLGFIKDIRFLLRRCPKPEKRLGMLFSATLSLRVTELAYEHMNNPLLVKINPEQVAAERVTQVLYHVANEEKIPLLLGLLRQIDPQRTIVFVNTKRTAETVAGYLLGNDYQVAILSGDVPQKKRQRLFQQFSAGELPILVATDLAARGLHIPEVSHVFNFDLPQNAEDFIHRIGRTARAGASGDAVSFGCEEFIYSLMEIEEYLGHKIPTETVSKDLLVEPKPPKIIAKKPRNHQPRRKPRRRNGGGHSSG